MWDGFLRGCVAVLVIVAVVVALTVAIVNAVVLGSVEEPTYDDSSLSATSYAPVDGVGECERTVLVTDEATGQRFWLVQMRSGNERQWVSVPIDDARR